MAGGDDTPPLRVGPATLVMDNRLRRLMDLDHWPDGTIGFGSERRRLTCLAANGATSARLAARRDGERLRWEVIDRDIGMRAVRRGADYAAGGPRLVTPDGRELVVYHGELHDNGDHRAYWSFLGLSVSDGSGGFVDLGPIVSPGIARLDPVLEGHGVEMGSGTFVVHNGFLHVYFSDVRKGWGVVGLGVARASLTDVLARARRGEAARFWKLCDGEFSSPALGGAADDLLGSEINSVLWFDAAWWSDLAAYVVVYAKVDNRGRPEPSRWSLLATTSVDGRTWTTPRPLIEDSERELIYVSIRSDPRDRSVEGPLDLWWLSSARPDFERWSDARLMRCSVTAPPDAGRDRRVASSVLDRRRQPSPADPPTGSMPTSW